MSSILHLSSREWNTECGTAADSYTIVTHVAMTNCLPCLQKRQQDLEAKLATVIHRTLYLQSSGR